MTGMLRCILHPNSIRRADRRSYLIALTALIAASSPGQSTARTNALAITSVNVIDVAATTPAAAVRKNQTVIVTQGRITSIGDAKTTAPPPDAALVDGSGKYLIPGLWDMHAHVLSPIKRKTFLPLYIANGVTSVRDMATAMKMDEARRWRDEINDGILLGPRLQAIAGPQISGPGTRFPRMQVSNPMEARRAVIARKEMGVDFIKVTNGIPRGAYFAIADEARKQNLTFVGHVPEEVTVAEAVEAGQRSIEHGRILLACSPLESEIASERLLEDEHATHPTPFMLAHSRFSARARKTCSDERVRQLARLFVSKGAWLVPTLVQGYAWQYIHNGATPYPDWLKYMPASYRKIWKSGNAEFGAPTDQDFADAQANFDKTVEIVGAMHRAGVNIMAGTDANGPFIGLVPGISLHSELSLFVKAGFTPLDALRSATILPASFLHLESTTGSVDPGKVADLVLLDANPVEDIGNTQRVRAVIVGGRLYDRGALDRILAEVADEARRN